MFEDFELSDEAKAAALWIGFVGACVGLSYLSCKLLAAMFSKAVVKELVKAGIIAVAL